MRTVAAVAMVLMVAAGAWAYNPHTAHPLYLPPVPDELMPTVDGVLDEWGWVPDDWVYTLSECLDKPAENPPRAGGGEEYTGAGDWDVPFLFVGYNATTDVLVVAAQVVDDVGYWPSENPFETWKGMDSIYWYVNGDGQGGPYQYEEGLHAERAWQGIWRPDLDNWWGAYSWSEEERWPFTPPYLVSGLVLDKTTGSYTMEATITVFDWCDHTGPDASTKHDMEAGSEFGMRFTLFDVDSESDQDYAYLTFNGPNPEGIDNAFTADNFERAVCLSFEDAYPGGIKVAVEPSTWGQIKSMLK